MSRYSIHGRTAPYAVVTVYESDGVTLAQIYSSTDSTYPQDASTVQADGQGRVVFYADPADYPFMTGFSLSIIEDGGTPRAVSDVWSTF
jgi:hypothetical protein